MFNPDTDQPETFEEFCEGAETYYRQNRDFLRRGQAYYNYLAIHYREVANDEINGTPADPFYVDDRVNTFLQAVRPYFN